MAFPVLRSASPSRRDEGFTLAEVIVSLSILVIVAASVSALVIRSLQATSATQMRVTATNLAEQDLAQMRALNSANKTAQIVNATSTPAVGINTFTLTRTVTQCNASTGGGPVTYSCGGTGPTCAAGSYKTVTTSISWPKSGRPVVLTTRIAC